MTYRVASEWVGLKRDKTFPSIDFLHPNTFSVDWTDCVLIRLLDQQEPLREDSLEFEFIGDGFNSDSPALAAGARVSSVPKESLLFLTSLCLRKLFERQSAVIFSGCRPWRSSSAIYFRAIAVPFSDNRGELKYGLGAFSHTLSEETISVESSKAEFLEFRNGGWLPINEISSSAIIRAA